MIKIGLTGSIAMGKSGTAALFQKFGIPVHDADRTVHFLMEPKGAGFEKIACAFPDAIQEGQIDRQILGNMVFKSPQSLKRLEDILHPLVRAEERKFIRASTQRRDRMVVLDIPLLFETGGQKRMDYVCVASATPLMQRKRALMRPGMTPEKLKAILSKQMSDFEKRKRADFIIFTGNGYRVARNQVKHILQTVKKK